MTGLKGEINGLGQFIPMWHARAPAKSGIPLEAIRQQARGTGKGLSGPGLTQQRSLRQLVEELKTSGLEQSHHDEILDFILANIG